MNRLNRLNVGVQICLFTHDTNVWHPKKQGFATWLGPLARPPKPSAPTPHFHCVHFAFRSADFAKEWTERSQSSRRRGATWLLPSAPICRRLEMLEMLEMPPVPPAPPAPCSALMRGPGRQRLTPRWRLAAVRDANILPSTLTPLTPQSFTIYSFHFISMLSSHSHVQINVSQQHILHFLDFLDFLELSPYG